MALNPPQPEPPSPPLRRANEGRLVVGVAAGLAAYFDVDVVIVRIAFVVLALVGGIGLPLYAAAWLLVPEEGSDHSVADDLAGRARSELGHWWETTPAAGPPRGSDHGL
jgi:phage shock protein PspC (stress-responsive transcriptional regulator)